MWGFDPEKSSLSLPGYKRISSSDTKATLPSKINTPKEIARIFVGPADRVSFTWV